MVAFSWAEVVEEPGGNLVNLRGARYAWRAGEGFGTATAFL